MHVLRHEGGNFMHIGNGGRAYLRYSDVAVPGVMLCGFFWVDFWGWCW